MVAAGREIEIRVLASASQLLLAVLGRRSIYRVRVGWRSTDSYRQTQSERHTQTDIINQSNSQKQSSGLDVRKKDEGEGTEV